MTTAVISLYWIRVWYILYDGLYGKTRGTQRTWCLHKKIYCIRSMVSWFQLLRVCICLLILQCLTTIFSQLNWLGLNLSRSRFCLGLDTLWSWSWLGLTLDVGRLFCILCLRFRTDTLLCITTETLIRLFFFFAASLDIHCIVICQSNASPPLEQNRTVRDKNVHIQIDNSRRNATAFILASFLQHDGSFRLRLISTGIIESNQVNECLIGNALLRAV